MIRLIASALHGAFNAIPVWRLSVKALYVLSTLFSALVGLTFAALTQVGHAAHSGATEAQSASASSSLPVASAPTIAEAESIARGSALKLYAEDTNGNPFRMVLVQGIGWKYAAGWNSPERAGESLLRKVTFRSWTRKPVQPAASAFTLTNKNAIR